MNTKSYTVRHFWNDIELSAEIDFEKTSFEKLHAYVINHHEYSEFMRASGDDVIQCFLKLLANACFKISISNDLNIDGLIDFFDSSNSWVAELFPRLSGQDGVRLVSFTYSDLDPELFE
ncbi:DUF2528 family protein [Vibrio vulnificus]|nr:DUF2528 family protein [Vibrio vulnificus]